MNFGNRMTYKEAIDLISQKNKISRREEHRLYKENSMKGQAWDKIESNIRYHSKLKRNKKNCSLPEVDNL